MSTRTRVLAAAVMAPVAIASILFLPTPWLVALAAIVFLLGLREWFRLAWLKDPLQRNTLLAANLLLIVLLVWASSGSLILFQLVALAGALWWLAATWWLRHYQFASRDEGWAQAFKLAAGTLALIPAWCSLALLHAQDNDSTGWPLVTHGHVWLLTALAIVWAADSGAYFAGRQFGGRWFKERRLAPRISPNKTLEGLVGGLLAAVAVGLVLASFAGLSLRQVPAMIVLALVTAAFSVVGDLFESLLKRHAGVKDSGRLIPGHGGVLDRIDGILAALPVFVIGKDLFGL